MSDTIKRTAIWKGLNRSPFLSDGEMRDMKNLSSDAFPFITTRKGRKPYTFTTRIPSPAGEAYNEIENLPEASIDELGKIYKDGDVFYECYCENGVYGWRETAHPEVSREVTLKEYLDDYDGCGLKEILEIGTFNGNIAVLIIDKDGKTKLYHNRSLWEVKNVSGEAGKKLVPVGNRLVVGEAGNYLHIKDGVREFHEVAGAFQRSINGTCVHYGNGSDGDYKYSYAYTNDDLTRAYFEFYAPANKGDGFEEICEGLNREGTDFSITFNGKTYYMTAIGATYEKDKQIAVWKVGDFVYYDYADILTIDAKNPSEYFDWDRGSKPKRDVEFTFKSTDPHYNDVVAWKKRLWGYSGNALHGTVADIFDADGIVDWNTGDNTYTEAISQPLWQGGNITGVAALMEGLLYFKEDNITIVTGNYPAIMNSDTIPCHGLPPENRKSVTVANECVYYLSSDGVYRFGGGIPQCISRDVKIRGAEAVGASDGNKYWLSLREDDGEHALYVYDINYKTWHKEDNTKAISFTMLDSEMYMATDTEVYNITAPQEDVDWSFELWYDEDTHRKKKYKEFIVRGYVGECEMFIKADGGEWKLIKAAEDELRAKIPPFECEELGILIRGKGICEIKSIDRVFEVV